MTQRMSLLVLTVLVAWSARAGVTSVHDDQLFVDGQAQPQLFGAEVQYFRLRGGAGRNIPRADVLALWNRALDRLVEMHANVISFYIPWDFHEYAPGKFDFDGTVDEDGDGRPDYPSRDLKTWFRLIEEHGIHHILVRPGPYINAEWGFLGFGAVPKWFHEKYPMSHMQNARGQKISLFGYNDPDFLRESAAWLSTVYREVLAAHIGPGRPIDFLQVDNETNFQWQSIYAGDYSPRAVADYHAFLQHAYENLAALNARTHRTWASWADVKPPTAPGANVPEDQDWYRFQDETIHVYLGKIRAVWEGLGVREPNVLFTLAESYNVTENGLLPNYLYRNDPGHTGLMTVNLYPKTYGAEPLPLLNNPFKADHDVKAASVANQRYFGNSSQWTMGPEIQGGWWRGTDVTLEARQQTYLTTIGHGLKALFVYYFNEGDDWDYDWAKKQITPYFNELKKQKEWKHTPVAALPDAFWSTLDETVANHVLAGWSSKGILANGGTQKPILYFDAPLDENAQPRPIYGVLKTIGEKLVAPYGPLLGAAVEATDPVCFLKDDRTNIASKPGLDSAWMNSDWASGLVGYTEQVGLNMRVIPWGATSAREFDDCRVVFYQDNGLAYDDVVAMLHNRLAKGASVVSFIGTKVSRAVLGATKACEKLPSLFGGTACAVASGHLYSVRNPIYKDFNMDAYGTLTDIPSRLTLLHRILDEQHIVPRFRFGEAQERLALFARQSGDRYWVTAKSAQLKSTSAQVVWSEAKPELMYTVTEPLSGQSHSYSGAVLAGLGFPISLAANGSSVWVIEPTH